jgi:hypothetical protein
MSGRAIDARKAGRIASFALPYRSATKAGPRQCQAPFGRAGAPSDLQWTEIHPFELHDPHC